MKECLSERDALSVALGEVADGSTAHVFESKTLECFLDSRSASRTGKSPESRHESEEAIDAKLNVESRRFGYVAEAGLHGLGVSAG